ncbi:hypothetical protein EJD96_16160 [Herbaspirillum seropedicae]|uniref:helix-turn-helix transcriptional regulator n=1 Tax=Herbaspirillum seropedicae TaxID=964 RepID=UPI0011212D51|nr:helix-turn-helix domain-containing protein [Herbaspirillum seropedicae]QDD65583.1 hypothetical protein EJD96_16160 [Herbaspirillum seropedicae]
MQNGKGKEERAKEREDYIRNILLERFKEIPLLIRAKTVAEILGIPASTIYEHIRRGKFFMSYRLINESPMVDVEEFIQWYAYVVEVPVLLPMEEAIEEDAQDLDERRILLDSRIDPIKKFFRKEVERIKDEETQASRVRTRMR